MLDSQLSGLWIRDMYEEHLPDSRAVDQGLMKSLMQTYKPLKTLDLGCGLGYFVAYLREQGVDAWGVEAEDLEEVFKSPGHQIKKDLSQPFDLQEKFDLVVCLEVVEHIPRDFEEIVFDNIVSHMSRYLLFSGATVGQQGTGYINERPESHWFSHLVRRGLVLRHKESLELRLASTLPWYRNNVYFWELMHPDTNNSADLIAERDSRIISYEQSLNHQLQQLQEQYDQLQTEINQKRTELNQAEAQLITFQCGNFWRFHQTWLRIERAWKTLINQ